ncbi:PAS domain S-box protein [Pengzhenrongella sp.]|uniref:PAS domain S-box protein n=1 Tax=Pengzhenrongella sp. TaxID=2888820 RepID=UPI0039C940B5
MWIEQLVEAAPDGLVAVDADGVIRLVNHQTEVLFGHPRTELTGLALDVLIPGGDRATHPQESAGSVVGPKNGELGHGLEFEARRKDGSEAWQRSTGSRPRRVGTSPSTPRKDWAPRSGSTSRRPASSRPRSPRRCRTGAPRRTGRRSCSSTTRTSCGSRRT